jgi:hypothetical protein
MPSLVWHPYGPTYWRITTTNGRYLATVRRGYKAVAHVVALLVLIGLCLVVFNVTVFVPTVVLCARGREGALELLSEHWLRGAGCPFPSLNLSGGVHGHLLTGLVCLIDVVLTVVVPVSLFALLIRDPGIAHTPLTGYGDPSAAPDASERGASTVEDEAHERMSLTASSEMPPLPHVQQGAAASRDGAPPPAEGDNAAQFQGHRYHRRGFWAIVPMRQRTSSRRHVTADTYGIDTPPQQTAGGRATTTGPIHMYRKYCDQCMAPREARSSHCAECGVCVHDFDHHCGVTQTCVGRNNFRTFLLFVASAAALCDWVLIISACALWAGAADGRGSTVQASSIALIALVALSSLQLHLGLLLYLRLYVCLGVTLREERKRGGLFPGKDLAIHYEDECSCLRRDSLCCCGCVSSGDDEPVGAAKGVPRPFDRGLPRNALAFFGCLNPTADAPDGTNVRVVERI